MTSVVGSRLGLAVLVLAAEFVIFEGGLRLNAGSEAAPGFQSLFMTDETIGYRLKPGAATRFSTSEFDTDIRINTSGVRDEDFGPKPPNERRIVVLGDSLVLAVQVPLAETFCKQLEARLNQEVTPPGHYRVINAGVQGYGPIEEQLFFDKVASKFEADLVVLALYVANDAVEAASSASKLEAPQGALAETRENAWVSLRRVVRRSMVLQVARLRMISVKDRLTGPRVPEGALATYLPEPGAEVRRGLPIARASVQEIAKTANTTGAKMAILLIPAKFQLDDSNFESLSAEIAPSGATLIRHAGTERFKETLAGVQIPQLDLLPALSAAQPGGPVFFQSTAHFTRRGHEVVARALDTFLHEQQLLPIEQPASH